MLRGEHRQLAQDEQEAFLDQHANDALTRPAGVRSRAVYAMRNQCRSHVQLIEADNKLAASGAVLLAYGAHVARHTASVHSLAAGSQQGPNENTWIPALLVHVVLVLVRIDSTVPGGAKSKPPGASIWHAKTSRPNVSPSRAKSN